MIGKRRFNIKLFLLLLAGLAGLGVGVHFLHGAQVRRSAEVLLEESRRAHDEDDAPRERDYLERYLTYRPTDVAALVRLAELLDEHGGEAGRAQAIRVMERALRRDETLDDVRMRAVRLLLEPPPSFSAALPHAEVLERRRPDDGEAWELSGRAREGLGRFEEARDRYRTAVAKSPERVEGYVRLAGLLRARFNGAEEADRVMDVKEEAKGGLMQSTGHSAKAYLMRAGYRNRHGDPEGAAADIEAALAAAPEDVDVLVAAGLLARDRGRAEEAVGHLEAALKLEPERPALYQTLADVKLKEAETAPDAAGREARFKEALGYLEAGIDALPDETVLRYSLAAAQAQAGRLDEANETIEDLEKRGLRPELAQYLRAYVLMERQEWKKAAQLLEKAQLYMASQPTLKEMNKRVLMMLGRCYTQVNDPEKRYNAYRSAAAIDLENDPLWAQARMQLADALRSQGKIDEAIAEYRVILPRMPSLRVPLAQLLVLQYLQLPEEKRRWPFVEELLRQAGRDAPDDLRVPVLRAELLADRGQPAQARELLERTRDEHPGRIEPWQALLGLAERQKDDPLAMADRAEQALGSRLELAVWRADYWGRRKGPEAPEELVKLERVADGLGAAEQNQLWARVAMAYAQIGVLDRAQRLWRQLAERLPGDIQVQLTGFDLALQGQDEEAARRATDRLRELEGDDGVLWRYAEAVLLARRAAGQPAPQRGEALERAREELTRVAAARPRWSRPEVALGEVALAQGEGAAEREKRAREEEATRHYLRAIDDLRDRSPGALITAAQLLYRQRRFDAADRMVQYLRAQNVPVVGSLRRMVAEIAFRNRDYQRALEQAQEVVSDDSDDPKDLIWLGRLRWAAGQATAEATLRNAVKKGPELPETHLALIGYLARTGRRDAALEALADAERQLPAGKSTPALAEANELAGRADRARELHEAALEAHPEDLAALRAAAAFYLRSGRSREATAHLKTIVAKHAGTPEAKAASRTLALVMAAGGNRVEAVKAVEMFGAGGPDAGPEVDASLDDLRTKAQVLAMQPNRMRRQEAIGVLDRIVAAGSPRPGDLFLLAQLHEANGDWDESRIAMRKLIEAHPGQAEYLAAYTRALLRHNELGEAQAYLERLEKAAPGQPGTLEVQARVLHARKKDPEAVKLLRDFAAANAQQPKALDEVARLLEELGQNDAAEEIYRELYRALNARSAEAVLPLAGFLGRRGRTAEALDLIDERVWKMLPAEVASNASVVLLYGSKPDDEQYERVGERLKQAIAEHPESVPIQFDLANLRSLQGRYEEAAAIYRKIFERAPSRGVPLNNLAWMLALQGGRSSEALEAIGKAMELEGETPELLDTRALIYLGMDRTDEAIEDLENALVVQPKNADIYFHLAQAYRKQNKLGEALGAFRQAQTLGLTEDKLHPLERPYLQELRKELERAQ